MSAQQQNFTLGRGQLHFGQFKDGTQAPQGERYFGNTPDLSYNIASNDLIHYSSDEGVKEQDDSVQLQVDRKGSFTTDNISPENLALFWLGTSEIVTITAATAQSETISDVEPGLTYQLGASDVSPAGVRNVSNVVVKDDAGTPQTFTEGTDYTVDLAMARITPIAGGAITKGTNLKPTYDVAAGTQERVVSGSSTIEGSLRFIAKNPKGKQMDYFFPWVAITPNGDFAIKGDNWQTIPFNIEIKKKSGLQACYIDGRPATTP